MTGPVSSGSAVLRISLERLIEAIEEENEVLGQQTIISHGAYTDRKNHALRELLAAQRRDLPPAAISGLKPLLAKLADILQENGRLLKLHITAVGEISDIIVSGIRQAESDGTYSRHRSAQQR